MQSFIGTGVALVTPFKKDFSVDVDALTRIVNYVIEGGVEYLVVLGTTAETATLSQEEKELVIDGRKESSSLIKQIQIVTIGLGYPHPLNARTLTVAEWIELTKILEELIELGDLNVANFYF